MKSNSVLVFSLGTRGSLRLQEALRFGGGDVTCLESEPLARNLIEARAVDAVVVDADGGVPPELLCEARDVYLPVVAVTSRADVVSHMLRDLRLPNIIVAPTSAAIDPSDLIATQSKLVRREAFGVRHYVEGAGVRYTITDEAGCHYAAIQMRDDLRLRGMRRKDAARVALLANQLATAVLDSGHGGPIGIEVTSNERTHAVAARFGGMDFDALEALVQSCARDEWQRPPAMTDLGLPSVLSWCRTVIVNAVPFGATEIIGLLPHPLGESYTAPASLHLSVAEVTTPINADAAPIASIDLSDSIRQQLRDAASRGEVATAACVAIERETTSAIHAAAPVNLSATTGALRAAAAEETALKVSLAHLADRYGGGVVFEVGNREARVWAATGTVADPEGLHRFILRMDETSILGFLAREAALLQGPPGRSAQDQQLACLVGGEAGSFAISLSVAVSGNVQYILYGCDPVVDHEQATRELEVVGAELARAIDRCRRDSEWRAHADTERVVIQSRSSRSMQPKNPLPKSAHS